VCVLSLLTGSPCNLCGDGILHSNLGATLHHLEVHGEEPKQKKHKTEDCERCLVRQGEVGEIG
jgi:hypothetical protein